MPTPSKLFLEATGAPLKLGRKLGSGGEGEVYEHLATGSAVKLLKNPTPELEEKLRAMRRTPPKAPGVLPQGFAFSWPRDLVVGRNPSGPFIGFTMPAVSYRYALHQLYKPGTRGPEVDERFLLRATKNMAACVANLHQIGVIVGDLNESNVVVGPTGEVTFFDADSFQYRANGRTYRCLVGKSEFTARELFGRKYADQDRTRDTDAFALAVCIWLCLMEGNHPFTSRYTGPGNGATLKERIEQGIWAYAKNRHPHYVPRPMAPTFSSLPPNLRDLFRDAFEVGHHEPWKRPRPSDWALALADCEAQLAKRKPAGPSVTARVGSALRGIRRRLDPLYGRLPTLRLPTITPAVRTWAGRAGIAAAASILTAVGLLLVKAQSAPPQPTQPNAVRPGSSVPKSVSHAPGEETPRLWDELRRKEPSRLTKGP
jgi:DNA-binding helix-hairpin-helix protein with protein kinase domain